MRQYSITIDVHAPVSRVWDVMSDIERWSEWTSTVTSIRQLDPGPIRVGTRALIRQPKLPPAMWKVTELVEGRGFTWATWSPGVVVHARHGVEAIAGGSRVTLSLEFAGPFGGLVGRLTRALNERYLAIEAKGMKARSESLARSATVPDARAGTLSRVVSGPTRA